MSKVKMYKNRFEFEERELGENDYCYLDKDALEALLAGKTVMTNGDEFPIEVRMIDGVDDLATIIEFDGKEHDYDSEDEEDIEENNRPKWQSDHEWDEEQLEEIEEAKRQARGCKNYE